tara:strand:- start:296 stop:613 length:318 start_codon:yes stop_codon:yes gene_type:complete
MSSAREQLQNQAIVSSESIEWWKKEMGTLINKSEHWESLGEDHEGYDDAMDKIRFKMNYLLYKGEWENNNLLKLQQKINKFESEKAFGNLELLEKKALKKNKKRK